ncbi:MAG TPA: DUF134 domain-containing protein [Planctomycetaceae bacterium]|nr:DUF134 domain-containing protein [Planctomycetaceae bacterium]
MVRPKRCRRVAGWPQFTWFKPAGVPARTLREVELTVDEYEAMRLADYEGLYQEEAAERMGISRQTFGRIVESARNKVAKALVEGMALRIEGGEVELAEMRVFECADCGHVWEVPFGTGRPAGCPACQSLNFHRVQQPAGGPRGMCRRHRWGGPQAKRAGPPGRRGAGRGPPRD